MSEQRIPGRTGAVTIVSDGYGFGSIVTGPPVSPEPARPEVRRLNRAQVMKRFGWTNEDFEDAQRFGFPAASKRPIAGGYGVTLVWPENVLDKWASEQREVVTTLSRLLG